MRFAALQMNSLGSPLDNLKHIEKLLIEANQDDLDLIVLPENCLSLDPSDYTTISRQLTHSDGPFFETLSGLSQSLGTCIVAGSIPVALSIDDPEYSEKVWARSCVFDASGALVQTYDKVHLFDVDVEDGSGRYQESARFKAGTETRSFDCQAYRVGLSICYDLRFPGLYQNLRDRGAEIFVVPAAFTAKTGEAHWECLLRARAIEHQTIVIAANQWGERSGGRRTWGHSMVIGPWGEILNVLPQGDGLCVADYDMSELHKIRKNMPVNEHRKL